MCKHVKDILCPVCAKNEIYDLKRELKVKNLVIYFLGIDEGFIFDFDKNIEEFEEKLYKAVKYRSCELDNAFFKAIGRIKRMLYKKNTSNIIDSERIKEYLGHLISLELTYSIEKTA